MSPLTSAEADACVRFRSGGKKGHVESLFIKLNLSAARALWLKLTFLKEKGEWGQEFVEAWAIAFNLGKTESTSRMALKETWPAAEASYDTERFRVEVGSVQWLHGRLRGQLGQAGGSEHIAWDLRFETATTGFRHIPYGWMYQGGLPKSKATSPQVDTRFSGQVSVNGHTTEIDGAAGMLGHNWGSQHADSWVWAHCNMWEDADDVVFEGVTSKVKFGPLSVPLLTVLHLQIDGESFNLNGIWRAFRIKSLPFRLSWRFEATTSELSIEGRFSGPVDRFVGITYVDPTSEQIHCLNSKIADGLIRIRRKTSKGWLDWKAIHSVQTAALEIGDRATNHGVKMVL
jgi:hypothetical protein